MIELAKVAETVKEITEIAKKTKEFANELKSGVDISKDIKSVNELGDKNKINPLQGSVSPLRDIPSSKLHADCLKLDNKLVPREKLSSIENENVGRNLEHFSTQNQFVTSEQIEEFRNDPNHKPLIEGVDKNHWVLRQNMENVMGENANEITPENSRAHHIVGDNDYSRESRAILDKYGIDINSPENGIFLPPDEMSDLHGTIHNGKHTNAYNDEVTQRLKMGSSRSDILEILDSIKEDLYNGEIKLYNEHKFNA